MGVLHYGFPPLFGNNAFMFYKRGIGNIDKNVLPSTSPAYARMSIERKVQIWRNALIVTGDNKRLSPVY